MALQNQWRYCKKCTGLFWRGENQGRCPYDGAHEEQGADYTLSHDVGGDPSANLQDNWRLCKTCQGLFFGGNSTTGTCPFRTPRGGHDYQGSRNYSLTVDVAPASGRQQTNWRWCNKCAGLFFAGNTSTGYCPVGGGHDYSGSRDYVLSFR